MATSDDEIEPMAREESPAPPEVADAMSTSSSRISLKLGSELVVSSICTEAVSCSTLAGATGGPIVFLLQFRMACCLLSPAAGVTDEDKPLISDTVQVLSDCSILTSRVGKKFIPKASSEISLCDRGGIMGLWWGWCGCCWSMWWCCCGGIGGAMG